MKRQALLLLACAASYRSGDSKATGLYRFYLQSIADFWGRILVRRLSRARRMHFFYLDESGDTGLNLQDANQPIMVLGGISLRDEGWNATHAAMTEILDAYFGGPPPAQFELHAKQLLAPNGEGPFAGHPMDQRSGLARRLLELLRERKHGTHYFAINKQAMVGTACAYPACFDLKAPYLVAFDYLITYINWQVKERLGSTARGLLVFDRKEQFHTAVEAITQERRFGGAQAHRVKWIVEVSYAVDSFKNPMIQLSDLVSLCVRRFLEIDGGHHPQWTAPAIQFYAQAYALIADRLDKVGIEPRGGRHSDHLDEYLGEIAATPRARWRKHYGV